MITDTDSLLHYDVEEFGKAGFVVPNPGNDPVTMNETIHDLVSIIGQQILAMNSTADRDMHTPPDISLIRDLHKAFVRIRHIVSTRVVQNGEDAFRSEHNSPEEKVFLVFPTPYMKTRNRWIKRYTSLMLCLCSELMQHTESRREFDISPRVAKVVKGYMDRMYYDIATDLFNKPKEAAKADSFLLTEEDFAAWNWDEWMVDTEHIQPVVHSRFVFTEDQLAVLTAGIPATRLPMLKPIAGSGRQGGDSGIPNDETDPAADGDPTQTQVTTSWGV